MSVPLLRCTCGWPRPLIAVTLADGSLPRDDYRLRYDCPSCGHVHVCGEVAREDAARSSRAAHIAAAEPRAEQLTQVPLGADAAEHERFARGLATALRTALPPKLGFTLFLFDEGESGNVAHVSYISTANREEMVAVIRGWLGKVSP